MQVIVAVCGTGGLICEVGCFVNSYRRWGRVVAASMWMLFARLRWSGGVWVGLTGIATSVPAERPLGHAPLHLQSMCTAAVVVLRRSLMARRTVAR